LARSASTTTLKNLAELYRDAGRTAEAEPFYRKAVAVAERALGENHPDVVEMRAGYARIPAKSKPSSNFIQ